MSESGADGADIPVWFNGVLVKGVRSVGWRSAPTPDDDDDELFRVPPLPEVTGTLEWPCANGLTLTVDLADMRSMTADDGTQYMECDISAVSVKKGVEVE